MLDGHTRTVVVRETAVIPVIATINAEQTPPSNTGTTSVFGSDAPPSYEHAVRQSHLEKAFDTVVPPSYDEIVSKTSQVDNG